MYCRVVWTPPRPPPTSATLKLGYDDTAGAYPGLSWARECLHEVILRFVWHFSNNLSDILYQNASQPYLYPFHPNHIDRCGEYQTISWVLPHPNIPSPFYDNIPCRDQSVCSGCLPPCPRLQLLQLPVTGHSIISLKSHPYIGNARGVSFNLCALGVWRGQAAELAEVYWMALARDVPFTQYGTDEITTTAAGTYNNNYFRATPHLTALLP